MLKILIDNKQYAVIFSTDGVKGSLNATNGEAVLLGIIASLRDNNDFQSTEIHSEKIDYIKNLLTKCEISAKIELEELVKVFSTNCAFPLITRFNIHTLNKYKED